MATNKRAFVIEDSSSSHREMMFRAAVKMDYEVEIFFNVHSALEHMGDDGSGVLNLTAENRPDLIITDNYTGPGENGHDLLRAVRNCGDKGIALVMVANHVNDDLVRKSGGPAAQPVDKAGLTAERIKRAIADAIAAIAMQGSVLADKSAESDAGSYRLPGR